MCRFCFINLRNALIADEAAKKAGGRVIMCSTHEPPSMADEMDHDANGMPHQDAGPKSGKPDAPVR